MDGLNLTAVFEAVNTPSQGGPSAADRHFVRRAGPGRKALDIAKNQLCWKVKKCVTLPRKTRPQGLDFRRGRVRPRRSIHYRFGVRLYARYLYAHRQPKRYHQSCSCSRGVCRHAIYVRSGWLPVNGRDMY